MKSGLRRPCCSFPTGQAWHRLSLLSFGACMGTGAGRPVSLAGLCPREEGCRARAGWGRLPGVHQEHGARGENH